MTFRYLLSLLAVFAVLTAEAQINSAPALTHLGIASNKAVPQKGGIRFLLRNKGKELSQEMVAQIDAKTFLRVELGQIAPGRRIAFPKDGILRIYSQKPQQGKPINPLYAGAFPIDQGNKILGIVSDLGDKFRIDYISEQELRPGRVLLMNLTNKPFLMNIKNVDGELSQIPLNPETKYVFGKNQSIKDFSISFPAQLMQQVDTKTGKMWVTERKLRLECYKNQSAVFILIPDKTNTRMQVYSTAFYMDN